MTTARNRMEPPVNRRLGFEAVPYLSYHPHLTQGILKYMYTVRSAASRFGSYGWRQYDINFRMRQQRTPQRSWSLIDGELWDLFVISPPISRNASNPSSRPFQANRNPASVTQGQSRTISSRGSSFKVLLIMTEFVPK